MEKGLREARRAARVDRVGFMSTATTSWRHDRGGAQLGNYQDAGTHFWTTTRSRYRPSDTN